MIGRKVSHYLIESLLGEGGMGEVYLARDLALGREAAVKILSRAAAPSLRERALREARASARLQHPSIATFFEAGQTGEADFIAMEYVRGKTLRDRLSEGPLPVDRAVGVAASVLEALGHAHAAGILHRDIKPENLMLTREGTVKVLDFGLAKRIDLAEEGRAARMPTLQTMTGMILGTPGYMPPEQVRSEAVDPRTDLFAVGAVLYESISGHAAFPGSTTMERLTAVLLEEPPAALEAPGVTPALREVVGRALSRDPAARYQTAAEFLFDLQKSAGEEVASGMTNILAVTDFENLSGDPSDGWIGSAMAESLTGELAQLPGLEVIAREKVLRTRAEVAASNPTAGPLDVGLKVGCRWVVSGAFQKLGPTLRITARLTDVPTARIIASEKVDGALADLFQIQDRLSTSIAKALPVEHSFAARPAGAAPNLEAYEKNARARRLFHRLEKGSLSQSLALFEEAARIDPSFAAPYEGMAAMHAMEFTFQTDRRVLEKAATYARRAIELDPTRGAPHIWLGYSLWRQGHLEEAIAEFRKVIDLDPANPYGPYFLGCSAWSALRWKDALEMFQRAVQLESHGMAWLGLGMVHTEMGRFTDGEWCLAKAIELEGKVGIGPSSGTRGYLGECLRLQGKLAEARAACMAGIESAERSDHMYRDTFRTSVLGILGRVAFQQGDRTALDAASEQAIAHIRGRSRTLGGGHLLAQALAGQARARNDAAPFEEAVALFEGREGFDFSWFWLCTDYRTLLELSRSARSLGRIEEAESLLDRAREAGATEVLLADARGVAT